MNYKLLVDGDMLLYKAGFGAAAGFKESDKEVPVSYCLHNLSSLLKGYKRKVDKDLGSICPGPGVNPKIDRVVIYLTVNSLSNFRYKVAKTKEYKGNRKDSIKPPHFEEMKEYLIKRYGAIPIEGMEADDALGIAAAKSPERSIILSSDKDLRMVPGWHWEMGERPLYYVDSYDVGYLEKPSNGKMFGTGYSWFYAQCLMGDRADNIPGLKGYGVVKVYNVLKDAKSIDELMELVVKEYDKNKVPISQLEEVKELLWILQEERNDGFKSNDK